MADAKITPAEWKERLEVNRQLRTRFSQDPDSLTEEEKMRALVLLQRDQRKARRQQDKKSGHAAGRQQGQQTPADKPAGPAAPRAASSSTEPAGYPADDPRNEYAASLRDAISEKKRQQRLDRGFKTKREMGWAPQADASKLEQQRDLRARFRADPAALSAEERSRAEILLARDARKVEKREKRAKVLAERSAAVASSQTLAKKWGFSEKMAAVAASRLKKGLKRGDWECPKCKNKNFARRTKCLKCDEPVPQEHSRWASLGSKEFENQDKEFWADKQKAAIGEADASCWDCAGCGIGNAAGVTVCFRCGKHRGSTRLDSAELDSDESGEECTDDSSGSESAEEGKDESSSSSSSSDDSSDSSDSSDDDEEHASAKGKGEAQQRDASEDWTCPRCRNKNWGHREVCNRCPQKRGEPPPPTEAEKRAEAARRTKAKKAQKLADKIQ